MISGVDIEDWDHIDFKEIVQEMPEEERNVGMHTEEDGTVVIDMEPFVNAFGRALIARIKMSVRL